MPCDNGEAHYARGAPVQVSEPEERSQQLVDQLVCVWERSVRASHSFLGEKDVERIKTDDQGEPYPLLRMELQTQA